MLKEFSRSINIGKLLSNIHDCSFIDEKPGVYIVVYNKKGIPSFKNMNSIPGVVRHGVANASFEQLENKWVLSTDKDQIVYIGKAGGEGEGSNLRTRIRQYISFGLGNNSPHRGGRYIWQIDDVDALCIYFKEDSSPRETERRLIQDFKNKHGEKRPFANHRD